MTILIAKIEQYDYYVNNTKVQNNEYINSKIYKTMTIY